MRRLGDPRRLQADLEHALGPRLIPVAISGGAGSRLWPLSTQAKPKQFHALATGRTLLQDTVLRTAAAEGIEVLAPVLICNNAHLEVALAQMAEAGLEPAAIVLEPFGRNTAAVAMTAALVAQALDPEALVLLAPSDHVIAAPEVFAAAVLAAAPMARERIITFGVRPTKPETGYGYIEAGERLDGELAAVARFVEKPNLETAQGYLASGRYLWNAGIFLFAPPVLIAEMERLAPGCAKATREAVARAPAKGAVIALDAEAFDPCPSISLDYAVMERTDKAAVMPLDAGWADIGSWSSLWEQGPHDEAGNRTRGDVELIDAEDCLVWSEGGPVGVIGLKDMIVVHTAEATVVLPKSRAQDVKLLVERIKARGGR